MHVFVWTYFHWPWYVPESGVSGSYVNSVFNSCLRTLQMKVGAPFYIHMWVPVSLFQSGVKWCLTVLPLPWWLKRLSIFSHAYWLLVYICRNVYSILYNYFKLSYSFYYWIFKILYTFLIRYMICKYFSHSGLLFHFLYGVLEA